jgi:HSP20 family molecular chaperone IbpA
MSAGMRKGTALGGRWQVDPPPEEEVVRETRSMMDDLRQVHRATPPLEERLNHLWVGSTVGDEEWFATPAELRETLDAFVLEMDLSATDQTRVEVGFREQLLDVTIGEEGPAEPEGSEVLSHRAPAVRYHHRFEFAAPVLPREAEATIHEGVLTITVPKARGAAGRPAPARR